MSQKYPKNSSDAVLALPQVRRLLLEEDGPKAPEYTRGGVKAPQARMTIDHLVQDKFYDGKIVRKIGAGLLIDINATCPGLLRWRLVRGVPKELQKVGGFLGNLLVIKKDLEAGRFDLKLQGIGFGYDTFAETDYKEIHDCIHGWSELPGAPSPRKISTDQGFVQAPNVRLVRALPPLAARLRRRGKMGPRSLR